MTYLCFYKNKNNTKYKIKYKNNENKLFMQYFFLELQDKYSFRLGPGLLESISLILLLSQFILKI